MNSLTHSKLTLLKTLSNPIVIFRASLWLQVEYISIKYTTTIKSLTLLCPHKFIWIPRKRLFICFHTTTLHASDSPNHDTPLVFPHRLRSIDGTTTSDKRKFSSFQRNFHILLYSFQINNIKLFLSLSCVGLTARNFSVVYYTH